MQFFKQLTDPALKRLYKFVLKRMIGRFLTDELDLDQLDVHLRSGRLELCDLLLNADVLNAELCEAQGLPFKVKKGYLGSVRVAISYASIMSESCLVEIDDIEIILVPLDPDEVQTRQSFTGNPEERQDKVEQKAEQKTIPPEPVDEISQEGLDFVASWIEQVTSKIKVTLSNICLRLETGEQHNGRDVALLCKLQWAQFTDESASEVQSVYGRSSLDHPSGMYGSQTMGGGTQSMAASTLFGISQKGIKFRGISMDLHLSTEEEGEEDRWTDRRRTEYSDMVLHPFLSSDPNKQNYIQVKLSHYEALEAPAMDADVFFHSIRIVLQPQYFPELGKIVDAFSTDPAKLNAYHPGDQYTSAAMFKSICDDRPAWMTGSEDDESDEEGGALKLSFKEFQRIEQLLVQYRQTQDELQIAQRRRKSTEDNIPTEGRLPFKTRKLSAAESVESIGLSDLEDDDDGFFECDPGLASSIAPGTSLGSSTMMSQSMYASARYGFDENEVAMLRALRPQSKQIIAVRLAGGHGHGHHENANIERKPDNYRPGSDSYAYENPWPKLNGGRLDWLFQDGWRRPLAKDQGAKMRREWIWFNQVAHDEHADWYRFHLLAFFSFTALTMWVTWWIVFLRPDWPQGKEWALREAHLEIVRRKKAGLPLISKDLIDPKRVALSLPSEEELRDFEILI